MERILHYMKALLGKAIHTSKETREDTLKPFLQSAPQRYRICQGRVDACQSITLQAAARTTEEQKHLQWDRKS